MALLAEPKALGGVARHGLDAGTRLLALERLTDAAELEAVALNGEYADAAVAALDRLAAPSADQLAAIAQRARTKAAAKRAKALLAAQTAGSAPAEPASVEYKDAEQEAARALVGQMEALSASVDAAAVRDGYAAARVAWVELLADADIRPAIVEEFETLSDRVRTAVAAAEARRADEARHAEALRQEQASRLALCERVEVLAGDDLPAGLAAARAEWEAMPPMAESWAPDVQRRFDEATRAAERRQAQLDQARELAGQAPAVVEEAEGLVAADYAAIRGQWQALRRKWQAIGRVGPVEQGLADRFATVTAALEAREQEVRASRQKHQEENLHRLQGVVQGLETRAAAESLTLKDADTLIKDVKLAIGTMGPLPNPQDREDLTVRMQAVRAAVTPRLEELRNAEEWKRWANVQVQEDLCTKMEALVAIAEAEPETAANEMRALQEKWKPVAAAPRSQAEALWTRFKAAQGQVYEKCKDYFSQQAAERQEALKKKEALCDRAEAIAESTDWVRTAEAMKTLQAEWKAIGPVTRGREKAVWERFRKACDTFFTRRQNDMKQRKQDWGENLARKEALIAEAEQLAQSTQWDQAAARLKALQVEWKTIGPVKKSKSDQVWERFRAACDRFFERFKHRDQDAIQTKFVDRDTAVAEIEALVPADDAPMPDDLYNKVAGGAGPLAAGPRAAAPRPDAAGRAGQRRAARAGDAVAGRLHRRRARPGGDRQAHGEAVRQGGSAGAAGWPRPGVHGGAVTSRTAGAAMARSAGRQHHGRRRGPSGRGGAAAGRRPGTAQRAVGVAAVGSGAARHPQAAAGALRSRGAAGARQPAPLGRARVTPHRPGPTVAPLPSGGGCPEPPSPR